ncbi:hypothetical protein IVA88_24965 [Bradyrhizobium sp. 149]|uniref:caspase family protein n=1 Tax=Bradyrhizobium sp. 149 TaxID=2782624 RepID=UPI001FF8E8CE|nr:caspase family protein [Bradyrhizobium sp. 149]MCK1654672.1 hypothetical protein [Bradyrhizobium sp. 149]
MPLADYALIVGINLYPALTSLQGAENDARDFHDWVISPDGGGVASSNATLLVTSNFAPFPSAEDAKPAAHQIEDFFTKVDIAANSNNKEGLGLKAGKRIWLFFSGHGFAPTLDRSAVLLANATSSRVHNVAALLWADRLHEGGWFDDVFLFQDACRSHMADVDLTPPFLRKKVAPLNQVRRRFYAFSAKNRQISKEVPIVGERVQGVFTTTLLQGLKGKARDPHTGALTAAQLKAYLQDNMIKLLPAGDLADDEIAKMPEVVNPDPFDILPPTAAAVSTFPVSVKISQPGGPARIENSAFVAVDSIDPSPAEWQRNLPRGLYKLVVDGLGELLFQVTGATAADGTGKVVDVTI